MKKARKGGKTILGEKWLVVERAVYFLQTDQQTLHCILTNKQPGDWACLAELLC